MVPLRPSAGDCKMAHAVIYEGPVMGITHDSMAVQAFKKAHSGRAPRRSTNLRSVDEAWIQNWKAKHVARLCKDDAYAQYRARRQAWTKKRITGLRMKAAHRRGQLATKNNRFAT